MPHLFHKRLVSSTLKSPTNQGMKGKQFNFFMDNEIKDIPQKRTQWHKHVKRWSTSANGEPLKQGAAT